MGEARKSSQNISGNSLEVPNTNLGAERCHLIKELFKRSDMARQSGGWLKAGEEVPSPSCSVCQSHVPLNFILSSTRTHALRVTLDLNSTYHL